MAGPSRRGLAGKPTAFEIKGILDQQVHSKSRLVTDGAQYHKSACFAKHQTVEHSKTYVTRWRRSHQHARRRNLKRGYDDAARVDKTLERMRLTIGGLTKKRTLEQKSLAFARWRASRDSK